MTSPGFDIDTSVYRDLGTQLDGLRAEVQGGLDTLRATLDGRGNPWGSDQPGSLFGQLYTQVLTHVVDAMTTHQDQLTYAAESMRASAALHDDNDAGVAQRFTTLGGGLRA